MRIYQVGPQKHHLAHNALKTVLQGAEPEGAPNSTASCTCKQGAPKFRLVPGDKVFNCGTAWDDTVMTRMELVTLGGEWSWWQTSESFAGIEIENGRCIWSTKVYREWLRNESNLIWFNVIIKKGKLKTLTIDRMNARLARKTRWLATPNWQEMSVEIKQSPL
jgi:hypothetical protein